jgi:hypothetical protein
MSNEHRNDGSWRTLAPKPKQYKFTPKKDITSLEAAHIAHFMAAHVSPDEFPEWEIISRHFTEAK